jgi:hypothetical protein
MANFCLSFGQFLIFISGNPDFINIHVKRIFGGIQLLAKNSLIKFDAVCGEWRLGKGAQIWRILAYKFGI